MTIVIVARCANLARRGDEPAQADVIAATDAALSPAGDVTGAAYLNSFPGATTTVLYDIDSTTNELLLQNPPNDGTLTTIGALQSTATGAPTFDVTAFNGFDIAPAGGFGFLLSRIGASSEPRLLRVNLASGPVTGGRAVRVGEIDTPSVAALGLAVMSPGLLTAGSASAGENGTTATVAVVRSGGRSGPVMVDFATADGSATAGSDYTATSGVLRFADGETAKLVSVPLLDDAAVEGSRVVHADVVQAQRRRRARARAGHDHDHLRRRRRRTPPPPPPAAPPPPPAIRDRTPPLAFVSVSRGQTLSTVLAKGLKLKLVAGEPATAALRATITAAAAKQLKLGSRTIATGKATFGAAGVKTLRLKLPATGDAACVGRGADRNHGVGDPHRHREERLAGTRVRRPAATLGSVRPRGRHGDLAERDLPVVRRQPLGHEHAQAGVLEPGRRELEQQAVLEDAAGQDGEVDAPRARPPARTPRRSPARGRRGSARRSSSTGTPAAQVGEDGEDRRLRVHDDRRDRLQHERIRLGGAGVGERLELDGGLALVADLEAHAAHRGDGVEQAPGARRERRARRRS